MKHLNDAETVDWLDGQLDPRRAAHLNDCEPCRVSADGQRRALALALENPPAAPSPLFWDHFSARVSAAIREEATTRASIPAWLRWRRRPVFMWAAGAAVAVLMLMAVAWRATLHAPQDLRAGIERSAARPAPVPSATAFATDAPAEGIDRDEAWAVVRGAADGFGWDDAQEAGLTARQGSAEQVALELSAEERTELVRLLEAELKRTGA